MPKYKVYFEGYCEVDADNEIEAEQEALEHYGRDMVRAELFDESQAEGFIDDDIPY